MRLERLLRRTVPAAIQPRRELADRQLVRSLGRLHVHLEPFRSGRDGSETGAPELRRRSVLPFARQYPEENTHFVLRADNEPDPEHPARGRQTEIR